MGSATELLTMGCPASMRPVCDGAAIPTVMIAYQDAITLQRWVRGGQRFEIPCPPLAGFRLSARRAKPRRVCVCAGSRSSSRPGWSRPPTAASGRCGSWASAPPRWPPASPPARSGATWARSARAEDGQGGPGRSAGRVHGPGRSRARRQCKSIRVGRGWSKLGRASRVDRGGGWTEGSPYMSGACGAEAPRAELAERGGYEAEAP